MRWCEISHMSYALLMHLWLTIVFTLSAPPFDVINFFHYKENSNRFEADSCSCGLR